MRAPGTTLAVLLLALVAGNATAATRGDWDAAAGTVAVPADPGAGGGGTSLALGLLAGFTLPDPRLADYQWDISPHAGWGAQALLGRGRFSAGARVWRTQTTQRIDLPGVTVEPSVGLTSLEFVGMGRLAGIAGTEILLTAGVGRLHLAYDPDQISIPPSGPGTPILVSFAPVNEWTGGGGLALRRPFGPRWNLDLGVDCRVFGLDTAHRSGSAVVYQRETLGEWSARLALARMFHRH